MFYLQIYEVGLVRHYCRLNLKGGYSITANQVAYNNLLETKRHNIATESEAARHNYETESQGRASILEQTRHNQQTEANQRYDTEMRSIASKYAADLSYQSNIYSANMHYAATTYAANMSYKAQQYAANQRLSAEYAQIGASLQRQKNELEWKTSNENANRKQSYLNIQEQNKGRKTSSLISTVGSVGSAVLRLFTKK